MSNYNKIQKLKAKMEEELNNPQPNLVKINKLKQQIMLVGLGLTGRDILKLF